MAKPNGSARRRPNLAASLDYGGTAKMTLVDALGAPVLQDYDDPDNSPPVTITLHSADSDVYRKAQRDFVNARVARGRDNKFEDLEGENIQLLARATVAWEGLAYAPNAGPDDDVPEFPFSFENAVTLYTNLPAIREQVHRFINNRANFMRGPSKGSSASPNTTSGSTARSLPETPSPGESTSRKSP